MIADTGMLARKIMVLARRETPTSSALRPITEGAKVRFVHSLEEATKALRDEAFDLIVSDSTEFLALEHVSADHQAAVVLECLGQAACIIDAAGHTAWMNARMRTCPPELVSAIRDNCKRLLLDGMKNPDVIRDRNFNVATPGEMHYEVNVTPIVEESQGVTQMAAVAWDVTRTRRLQRKIDAIDMAGRDLIELDRDSLSHLNIEERLALLEQKILKYLHELLHFDNFAVMLLDKKTNKLDVVLEHGMSEHVHRLDIFASPEGNGISGYVCATGRSYICPDTSKDPRYLTGLERASSSLTVPLRLHDEVVGVFDVESEKPAAFNEDDRQFVEILGRYIAMALHVLELLVSERHTVTGRLAEDVAKEISAPLNDILTHAAELVEEYIGDDVLRRRLGHICDQVSAIRQVLREVARPDTGVLGRCRDEGHRDPLLFGKRVLVADDEDIIRETISSVLTSYGCEVDTARDGAQAITMLEQRSYDLVMADIKMPQRNGYEVFAAARNGNANCPVILVTGFGYDPNHSIVRARREGLAAVVFKPFKVDQLLDEVRKALSPAPAS